MDDEDLSVWSQADADAAKRQQERKAEQARVEAKKRLDTAIYNVRKRRAIPEQGDDADWRRWANAFCELWVAAASVGRGGLYERLIAHFRRPAVTVEFYKIAAHIFELAMQGHVGRVEQCLRHAKCKLVDENGQQLAPEDANATGRIEPVMDAVAEFCRKLETFQPDAESFEPPPKPKPEPLPLDEQIRAVFRGALELAEFWQLVNDAGSDGPPPGNPPVDHAGLLAKVFKPLDGILERQAEIAPPVLEELHNLVSIERRNRLVIPWPDFEALMRHSVGELEGIGQRGLRAMKAGEAAAIHPSVPARPQDTQLPPGLVFKHEKPTTPKPQADELSDQSIDALLDAAADANDADKREQTRQFWIQVCGMPAELTYEQGQQWAKDQQARSDAERAKWHAKQTAWERRIQERLRRRLLQAGFCDDELQPGFYVRCMPPSFVKSDDPRFEKMKEAMKGAADDEAAMFRALGCQAEVETEQARESKAGTILTFGELLSAVRRSKSAYDAAMKAAARQANELLRHDAELQAALLRFDPDHANIPGIKRVVKICDKEWGSPLTEKCLRKLRGNVADKLGFDDPAQVDAMTLEQVADAFEGKQTMQQSDLAPALAEALERAQEIEDAERLWFKEQRREKERRRPMLDAWYRIYPTRPQRKLGTPRGQFTADDWRPFAGAIIEFCRQAKSAGYDSRLRTVRGESDEETIALGLVVEGFKEQPESLAALLSTISPGVFWERWFNDDLKTRWFIEPSDSATANSPDESGTARRGDAGIPASTENEVKIGPEARTDKQQLTRAERLAYLSFVYAEQKNERSLQDQEAYDWLQDHEFGDNAGELKEYRRPAFDTWARYVREARRLMGESKYSRRAARPKGRSVIQADEIE